MLIDVSPPVPVLSLMLKDSAPVCIARPENPGIANVLPMSITVVDTGLSAELVGGGGVCLWVPAGWRTVKLDWKGMPPAEGSSLRVDLIPNKTVRLNICIIPRDAVRSSWTLKREGEPCAPQ